MKKILWMLLVVLAFIWFTYWEYGVVIPYWLNVREWASNESKVLWVIKKWESVEILETDKYWWKKIKSTWWLEWYVYWKHLTITTQKEELSLQNNNSQNVSYSKVELTWNEYEVKTFRANVRSINNNQKIIAILRTWDKVVSLSDELVQNVWIKVRIVSAVDSKYIWREWYISKKVVKNIWNIEVNIEQPKVVESEVELKVETSNNEEKSSDWIQENTIIEENSDKVIESKDNNIDSVQENTPSEVDWVQEIESDDNEEDNTDWIQNDTTEEKTTEEEVSDDDLNDIFWDLFNS